MDDRAVRRCGRMSHGDVEGNLRGSFRLVGSGFGRNKFRLKESERSWMEEAAIRGPCCQHTTKCFESQFSVKATKVKVSGVRFWQREGLIGPRWTLPCWISLTTVRSLTLNAKCATVDRHCLLVIHRAKPKMLFSSWLSTGFCLRRRARGENVEIETKSV